MSIDAKDLRRYVIEPTLQQLGESCTAAPDIILAIALKASNLNPLLANTGIGIYQMSPSLHRQCWDQYLAQYPDLASQIRGLASQHQFLKQPDDELRTNLAYATAMIWVYFQLRGVDWTQAVEAETTTRLCQDYFKDNKQLLNAAA